MGEEKKYMKRLDFNGELKYIKDEEARANLISEIQIDDVPVEKVNNTVNLVGFATTEYVDEKVASATHFKGGFAATGDGPIDNTDETLKSVEEKAGDTYVVTTAGTYLGKNLKIGDSILFTNNVAAGTSPTLEDFVIVEGTTEIDVEVPIVTPELAWEQTATLGSVMGKSFKVKMPANPDTNTTYTLEEGSIDGTISLKGSDGVDSNNIKVKGLGSAAYTDSTAYATSEDIQDLQTVVGGKADAASSLSGYGITDAKIENGTITLGGETITPLTQHQDISGKADNSEVVTSVDYNENTRKITYTKNGQQKEVVELGTAALTDSSDYATAAQGTAADSAIQDAGTGLSKSGTTLNHSNSIESGTASGSDGITLDFDSDFNMPTVTYDGQGHITNKGTTTVTMPANPVPVDNVTGSNLDDNEIIVGNGTTTIKSSGKTIATSVTDVDTSVPTSKAVKSYVDTTISNLPEPMVFRGSLGENGTITELPTDGSASVGDTYKVITDRYGSQEAKVGDLFICDSKTTNTNTWTYIPSADEPSGTVTSIKIEATSPITIDNNSAITSSGTRTISHANSGATAGSYGDSEAQTPGYGDTFKVPYVKVDSKGHVTEISDHTVKIPASDNTWRNIYVNGTELLNTDTSSGPVKFTTNIIGSASSWSAGTTPKLGTAIPADDITSWSAGALPSLTASEGVLKFNAGTLPDLDYTAKSIPNVTSVGTPPSLTIIDTAVVTNVSK